jgi:hypothetical protein
MRRAIIIAVLGLDGCSSERVQPIGLHQYMVTGEAKQIHVKATETCAKLDRNLIVLGVPLGSPANQFRFECVNSYEVVPAGGDSYRIRVLTSDIPLKHTTIPASKDMTAQTVWAPDIEPADKEAMQRATEYCAKVNQTMKITGRGFDTGPGLDIVFKCVPHGTGAP